MKNYILYTLISFHLFQFCCPNNLVCSDSSWLNSKFSVYLSVVVFSVGFSLDNNLAPCSARVGGGGGWCKLVHGECNFFQEAEVLDNILAPFCYSGFLALRGETRLS